MQKYNEKYLLARIVVAHPNSNAMGSTEDYIIRQ
tara:strand:- start:896 stop:997 length:102 start_codon:yes stop_codon:yes gene_type:complete